MAGEIRRRFWVFREDVEKFIQEHQGKPFSGDARLPARGDLVCRRMIQVGSGPEYVEIDLTWLPPEVKTCPP